LVSSAGETPNVWPFPRHALHPGVNVMVSYIISAILTSFRWKGWCVSGETRLRSSCSA
jgi:hypothetical protein